MSTTLESVTNTEIESLRTAAAEAGDLDMVEVCTVALADGDVTIHTAKGKATGDVRSVCAWQAEQQGAAATIGGVSFDGVDFDPDRLARTIAAVRDVARAVCAEAILSACDE